MTAKTAASDSESKRMISHSVCGTRPSHAPKLQVPSSIVNNHSSSRDTPTSISHTTSDHPRFPDKSISYHRRRQHLLRFHHGPPTRSHYRCPRHRSELTTALSPHHSRQDRIAADAFSLDAGDGCHQYPSHEIPGYAMCPEL